MSVLLGVTGTAGGQGLEMLTSPGPLSRFHADLGGLRKCTSCHTPGRGVGDDKCLACHEDLLSRVRQRRGFHRDKVNCGSCHHEHQGEAFELVVWDPADFDHAETGHDLSGRHANVSDCRACHKPGNAPRRKHSSSFLLNDTRCVTCHTDTHRGRLGEDCGKCHSVEASFTEADFNHEQTAFPLSGSHRKLSCDKCHRQGRWAGIRSSRCTDCHTDPHRPTLGADCRRCHQESSWTRATFDHERARFQLSGKHVEVECVKCHREGLTAGGERKFRGVAFEQCRDCHDQDPHFGQFDRDCADCHDVSGFEKTSFNHGVSRYPLLGRHASLACEKCHARERDSLFPAGRATAVRYRPIETGCASCHVDVHLGQFEESCERCHVTEGFSQDHLRFRHDRDSHFPLRGGHEGAPCQRCHPLERGPFPEGSGLAVRYKPLSDFCIACHDNVHDESWWRGDGVAAAVDCERCHSDQTFELESFDHPPTTFQFDGAHQGLACESCHDFAVVSDQRYVLFDGEPRDCAGCHPSPHLRGMERCLECHTTSTWAVGKWK